MPADRISPTSSLLETLRAMARDRAKGVPAGSHVSAKRADDCAAAPSLRAPQSIDTLREQLRESLAGVEIGNTHAMVEARKPVLRAILLWEFGSDFRKDPQFLPMLDALDGALEADATFQQRFVDLVAGLQNRDGG